MGFLFFVAVVGVIIYLSTQSAKATREKWKIAADRLNLAYYAGGIGSSGTISGELSGHGVTVSTYTRGSGNSSKTYTKYLLEYRNSIPIELKMTRQGAMHRLGQIFGLQDIEVGNPLFDDQVIVRGSHPDAVKRFLTPELQETIRALIAAYPDITISSEHVVVNKAGKDADPGIICHCIRRLESFCNELVDGPQSPSKPEHVYVTDEQPPAIPAVEPAMPPIPLIVDPPFDPLASADPIFPDIPEEEVKIEVEPEASVILEDPVLPAEAPTVDIEAVAVALYDGDSGGSLIISKVFDEQFKDRRVTGAGTLKRIGKFSYDPIFTNCSGVKATFDICEIADTYSKSKVTAEVKFPAEEYDALKAKIGTSAFFAGTLVAQDAMMHRIFVATK